MMKFLIAFITILNLAHAKTKLELVEAYDFFNYQVTKEWDQLDDSTFEKHQHQLTRAFKSSGATQEELFSFARSVIKDVALIKKIEALSKAVITNQISSQEAEEKLMPSFRKSPSRGIVIYGVSRSLLEAVSAE